MNRYIDNRHIDSRNIDNKHKDDKRDTRQMTRNVKNGMGEKMTKIGGTDCAEKNREYALRIMEALSGVDGELLEKSSQSGEEKDKGVLLRRQRIWRLAGTWAAVFCVAAVGAASWMGWQIMQPKGGERSGSACSNEAQAPLAGEAGAHEDDMVVDEGCLPTAIPGGEAETTPGDEAQAAPRDEAQAAPRDEAQTMPENGAAEDKAAMEAAGFGPESEWDNDSADYNIIGEKAVTENSTIPATGEAVSDGASNSAMKPNAKDYTEEEARKLEDMGNYIPDKLPEGYEFAGAYRNLDMEEPNLTVCWVRGTDRIVLQLEVAEESIAAADKEKPETYDERLYEIPFGETVPAEYRETFSNPAFAVEDLDLKVIESRMQVFLDSGETAVPRGNFRVLYPGNVVVSFNGQGTAEEIWEMFLSVNDANR